MNSQQDVIYGLMSELDDALDNGLPLIGSFTVVKKSVVADILDKLYAALPDEIKEARALLRRKDELQYEAQQKAEKVVSDAQLEADRKIIRIESGATKRYDGNVNLHYHLTCLGCGGVFDIFLNDDCGLTKKASESFEGKIISHSVLFTGYCPSCSKQVG